VTIAIFILIAGGDSGTPDSSALELFMVNIDTGVNNIGYMLARGK